MSLTYPDMAHVSQAILPRMHCDEARVRDGVSFEQPHDNCDLNRDEHSLAILVNTSAGGYKFYGRQRLRAALKRSEHASNARIFYCSGTDLKTKAQELAGAGARTIGVFGGDGSARTVALALRGLDVPMLPLPGGTLNRLCHRVHGHGDLDRVFADLRQSKPVWLSGGSANQHIFLVAAGFGPWMAFHEVRETVRAHGLAAGLKALGAMRRNLFGGKLSVNGSDYPSDVMIAAPDYVDQAFGFGSKHQVLPINGLELVDVRFCKLQDVLGLGVAVLTNSWRLRGHVRHTISTTGKIECGKIECGGDDIFGLVDGEKCKMGKTVILRHVPRAALVVSTRL